MLTTKESKIKQYLTFAMGKEFYAVDMGNVREVIENTEIMTIIPKLPDFILGVINIRGSIVPVVDIMSKFGIKQINKPTNNCIIVMEILFDHGNTIIGILADSVKEVFEIDSRLIEPPKPCIENTITLDFIKGIGKHDDECTNIIDLNKVFSYNELYIVKRNVIK